MRVAPGWDHSRADESPARDRASAWPALRRLDSRRTMPDGVRMMAPCRGRGEKPLAAGRARQTARCAARPDGVHARRDPGQGPRRPIQSHPARLSIAPRHSGGGRERTRDIAGDRRAASDASPDRTDAWPDRTDASPDRADAFRSRAGALPKCVDESHTGADSSDAESR